MNNPSGIDQNGIESLTCLEVLYANYNSKICDVNHLAKTLKKLSCSSNCGINQSGIQHLTDLKVLDIYGNKKITNINHLANTLIILDCKKSGVYPKNLKNMVKLKRKSSTHGEFKT